MGLVARRSGNRKTLPIWNRFCGPRPRDQPRYGFESRAPHSSVTVWRTEQKVQPLPTFEICIDEAGDDGFVFHKPGCAEWFAISAVVYPRFHHEQVTALVRNVKQNIGWKLKKPLHFKDIKGGHRQCLVNSIIEQSRLYRAIAVIVHKPSLSDPEGMQQKHRLYFYFTRYLLERASWLCRDAKSASDRRFGDGSARITFSNRTDMSYNEMREYFQRLQQLDTSIDWNVIRPGQFQTLTNGKHVGLQIADAVASGFYCSHHTCLKNKTDEWAIAFRRIMYTGKNSKYLGYGLKMFPECETTREAMRRLG